MACARIKIDALYKDAGSGLANRGTVLFERALSGGYALWADMSQLWPGL